MLYPVKFEILSLISLFIPPVSLLPDKLFKPKCTSSMCLIPSLQPIHLTNHLQDPYGALPPPQRLL